MLAIIDRRRKDPPRPLALGRVEMAEKRMLAISGRSIYMAPGTKSSTRHPSRFRSCILCYAMMLCYATFFLWKGAQIPIKAKTSETENRVEVQVSSAMLCYAILCYTMLCYAMLCYAMLCDAMLFDAMLAVVI